MTLLRPLLLALSLMTSLAACSSGPSRRVESVEAHTLVEHGATLLDVRSQGEWDSGHLPGAILVPVGELASRLAEVPRDRPVVVYCQSGGRSASATSMLAEAGYDVHDLGGIANW